MAFREVLNYDDHCTVVVVIIGPPISIFTERFRVFNIPHLEADLDYNVSVIIYVAGSRMAAALVSGPILCALLKLRVRAWMPPMSAATALVSY